MPGVSLPASIQILLVDSAVQQPAGSLGVLSGTLMRADGFILSAVIPTALQHLRTYRVVRAEAAAAKAGQVGSITLLLAAPDRLASAAPRSVPVPQMQHAAPGDGSHNSHSTRSSNSLVPAAGSLLEEVMGL